MSRYRTVAIICTDRRRHPSWRIDNLTDYRTDDPPGRVVGEYLSERTSARGNTVRHNRTEPVFIHPDAAFTYTFRCPRCSRTVQLREDNLHAALDRLYAVSPGEMHHILDMSYAD